MLSVTVLIFSGSYYKGLLTNAIDGATKLMGHVKIQHPDYKLKERMLSLTAAVDNFSSILPLIAKNTDAKFVTGRLKFGALINYNDENEPGLGMGIIPEKEEKILHLHSSIISGTTFTGKSGEAIIGSELRNTLNINVGDTITIISRTAYNSLSAINARVAGVCDFFNAALNKSFYVPLDAAQELLDMKNKVTEILIYGDSYLYAEKIAREVKAIPEISNSYEVLTWLDIGSIREIFQIAGAFISILQGIFALLAIIVIINTVLMAVFERTWEIGMINAIGMKQHQILILFILEGLMIGILGGIAGVIIGSASGLYLEIEGIRIGNISENMPIPIQQVIHGDLTGYIIIKSFIIGLVVSMLGALFPAIKASRMKPVDALRIQ